MKQIDAKRALIEKIATRLKASPQTMLSVPTSEIMRQHKLHNLRPPKEDAMAAVRDYVEWKLKYV
jgi:hypothetical protein